MRIEVEMERNGELHDRVKAYAREQGLRQPHAYAELLEKGLNADQGDH